jgi:hypothetical protein
MGNADPHIHVEVNVLHADVALRDTLAATFGLAGDLSAEVDTPFLADEHEADGDVRRPPGTICRSSSTATLPPGSGRSARTS